MNNDHLRGIFAPIVTPCDDAERMDEDRYAANIERLFATGIQGLYVCGGTGDAFKLTTEERKLACKTAVEMGKAKGKQIIVHVGSPSQRLAMELAVHAAEQGAAAVSAIPPAGLSGKLLNEYYASLASAGLPVIMYHIPAVTHHTPTFDEFTELLSMPGIAGLKMTDWNLFLLHRIIKEIPSAVVYNGYDEMFVAGLLYGAGGSIGTWINLFPDMYVKSAALVAQGRSEEAMRIQLAFMAFLRFAWKHGVIAVFEAIMKDRGYAERSFRRPFAVLSPAESAAIMPEANALIEAVERAVAETGGVETR